MGRLSGGSPPPRNSVQSTTFSSTFSTPIRLFLLILALSDLGSASFEPGPDYIRELIYEVKVDTKPCVRLLNSEGEVGCSTPESGTVGSLYPIETQEEYLDFVAHVSASWTDLKAITLAGSLFNKTIVDGLHQTKAVAGIALLPSNATGFTCASGLRGFSPAAKYPNKEWGLHPQSTYTWNPCGNDWFMEKFPFPVFAVNEEDGKDMLFKAKENKRLDSWPKWAAEFKAFMWGSGDSKVCLRRGYCDPVGGQSLWGSFEEGVDGKRDIIMVMAQMDSNSLFQDLALGAEGSASGVTTLLSAIQALADQRKREALQSGNVYTPPAPTKRQLVFALWTGETFGYLGSRRFVGDLLSFKCNSEATGDQNRRRCTDPFMADYAFANISFDRIYALVDLQQLGLLDSNNPTVYIHREPTAMTTRPLADLNAAAAGSGVSVEPAFETTFELPPSSLHSFLLANNSLPALLLSDFSKVYRNAYYNSRWDSLQNVHTESVCKAAGLVARTLYKMAYDAIPPTELAPNCTLVAELLDCLVHNNTCSMKQQLLGIVAAPNPPTSYSGLYRADRGAYNTNVLLIYQVLSWLASPQYYMPNDLVVNCSTNSHCPSGQNMGCVKGQCRNSSVFFHDAVPFGLQWDIDWGFWRYSPANFLGKYPQALWTEPTWDSPSLRVFKKEQFILEVFILITGVIVTAASFALFWAARRYLTNRFSAVASASVNF